LRDVADAFPGNRRAQTLTPRDDALAVDAQRDEKRILFGLQGPIKSRFKKSASDNFPRKNANRRRRARRFVSSKISTPTSAEQLSTSRSPRRFRRENDPFAILTKIRGVGNRKTGNFRSFQEKNVATLANEANVATF
jgi:hypothetical protein